MSPALHRVVLAAALLASLPALASGHRVHEQYPYGAQPTWR